MRLDKETQSALRSLAALGHIGFVLGGSVLLGWWIGRWCDGKFGTDPWLSVVGMLVFLAGGAFECWRLLKPLMTEDVKHDATRDGPPKR